MALEFIYTKAAAKFLFIFKFDIFSVLKLRISLCTFNSSILYKRNFFTCVNEYRSLTRSRPYRTLYFERISKGYVFQR